MQYAAFGVSTKRCLHWSRASGPRGSMHSEYSVCRAWLRVWLRSSASMASIASELREVGTAP